MRNRTTASAPTARAIGARAAELMDEQRDVIFGAMAMISVARDSLDEHEHCALRRVLIEAYSQLDRVWSELQSASCELSAEVPHG